MRVFVAASALLATALCAAHGVQPRPADVIHYRQSAMTLIGWNFGPLSAMVKGKLDWDTKEFALHADRLASLAPQVLEGFTKGSDKGAETDAKATIWETYDDFTSKFDDLVTQTRALSEMANGGDEAKIKEQFRKTAAACKNCHDKYKAD